MMIQPLDRTNPSHVNALVAIWNSACGADLAISARFAAYALHPAPGAVLEGRIAYLGGEPVGFALASHLSGDPFSMPGNEGWIDAIAVIPSARRQGIGSTLLAWCEEWLGSQGCHTLSLGAGLHPFVPGLPVELDNLPFFARRGYVAWPDESSVVWDLSANLSTYRPPRSVREIDGVVRPAQRSDVEALRDFLQREFPGRWHYEYEEHLAAGGRISDYMILWTERGIDGFCQLTFEDSFRPLERFYPYRLPRPWGQLGAIGVSADRRGRRYGAAVIDAGLRRLHNNGVNGCIIDWTDIPEFYAKFGFEKYRAYHNVTKHNGI